VNVIVAVAATRVTVVMGWRVTITAIAIAIQTPTTIARIVVAIVTVIRSVGLC
jgi:hypothetical protein